MFKSVHTQIPPLIWCRTMYCSTMLDSMFVHTSIVHSGMCSVTYTVRMTIYCISYYTYAYFKKLIISTHSMYVYTKQCYLYITIQNCGCETIYVVLMRMMYMAPGGCFDGLIGPRNSVPDTSCIQSEVVQQYRLCLDSEAEQEIFMEE